MEWFVKTDKFVVVHDYGIGNEIVPGLFLGEIAAARSEYWKEENKITHVLACIPSSEEATQAHKRIPLEDSPQTQIQDYFRTTNQWLHLLLTKNKARVLVHCFAGISRSATMVMSYLIEKHDMSYQSAYQFTKAKRSCIRPNRGFELQLTHFAQNLAVNRAFSAIEKRKKQKFGIRQRRIFQYIWEYGDGEWKHLSSLEVVMHMIYASH